MGVDRDHPGIEGGAGAFVPHNHLTPLINGPAYFGSLAADLERLRTDYAAVGEQCFVYIAGFAMNWLYPGDHLTLPGSGSRLLDGIVALARLGVDVRILAWIPWPLALAGRLNLRPESADNLRTIHALRQEPALARGACLNLLSHPAGSAHAKLVVLGAPGWAAGYSGGMDLSPDRLEPRWLDVQARLEGPAVQDLYDFFRLQWNQNLRYAAPEPPAAPRFRSPRFRPVRFGRPLYYAAEAGEIPAVVRGTPPVPARLLPRDERGSHQVRSLTTIPAFRFGANPFIASLRLGQVEFAPQGEFGIRDALRAAIRSAGRYIYIEDQYFWSVEVMEWIASAVRLHPQLRVILATGVSDQLVDRLDAYREIAVRDGLLAGLSPGQRQQVVILQRPEMVHAKTVLVDDRWAMIGSANVARRSLYTDIEHSLAFGDVAGQAVRDYRMALWASRLALPAAERGRLVSLDASLGCWKAGWGGADPSPIYRPRYQSAAATSLAVDPEWYAMIEDPDSRQPWHFPIRPNYERYL